MKTFLIVLMILTFYSHSFTQDTTFIPQYALSFGIKDNFTLSSFNMDIAVKKIFDNSDQLRLFISPRISTLTQDVIIEGDERTRKLENQSYTIGVGADYLWTIVKHDDISLFGGTGLIVSYQRGYSKNSVSDSDTTNNTTEAINPTVSAGIRGILGVEWKVSEKIGIHCEYLVTGSYFWGKSEMKTFHNGEIDINSKSISSGITLGSNVLFGLSIYL